MKRWTREVQAKEAKRRSHTVQVEVAERQARVVQQEEEATTGCRPCAVQEQAAESRPALAG